MNAVNQLYCKFSVNFTDLHYHNITCVITFISALNFRPLKNKHSGINISIRGIEIMNDDPSNVRYLFAKIESEALQQVADGILKRFIDAGNIYLYEWKIR